MYREVVEILDEQNRKRKQQIAEAPKHYADSFQGRRVGDDNENHEVVAEVAKPPLERNKRKIRPNDTSQGKRKQQNKSEIAADKVAPVEPPTHQNSHREQNQQKVDCAVQWIAFLECLGLRHPLFPKPLRRKSGAGGKHPKH